MGLNPLQPSELEAWSRLMGVKLRPWEVQALFKMDAAFLTRINSTKPKKDAQQIDARDGAAVSAQFMRLAAPDTKRKKTRHGRSNPPADH